MIVNLENGKFYIGSGSTNRLYERFKNHLIYFLGSDILAKAVEKYGLINFAFIILEYGEQTTSKENYKKLLELETNYLKKFNPPYNILTIAGSSLPLPSCKGLLPKF